MTDQVEDEKPLDPKVEKIRRKMVRLLVVSIGIMMIGLIAVLVAIFYKINQSGKNEESDFTRRIVVDNDTLSTENTILLPKGARHIASSLDGDRILLTIELAGGKRQLLVYNMTEAKILARYSLGN